MVRRTRQTAAWALLATLPAWAPVLLAGGLRAQESAPQESTPDQAPSVDGPSRYSLAVVPGSRFPSLELPALLPGATEISQVKLGRDLGSRPLVFFFFWLNHRISEEIYLEVQEFVESATGGKAALYPLVELGDRYELTELRERMELLGIRRPVLLDENRRIRDALNVLDAPRMALIHSDGNLVFSSARSLSHPIYGELTAADTIRMSVSGERPPSRQILPYYPTSDFIGKEFVDLSLPRYDTGERIRIGDMVEPGKLTALFYWSPEDQFSRNMLPALRVVQQAFIPGRVNLLAVARDGTRAEIRDLAEEHGLEFPIVRNHNRLFTNGYRVLSTPTLILIRPDGIVDSVYTSGRLNLFPVFDARVRSLTTAPPAPTPGEPSSR